MSSRNSKAPQAPTPGNIQALLDHVLVICREGGELTFREPSSERGGLPISERPRSGRPEDERAWVHEESVKRRADFLLDLVITCRSLGWLPSVLPDPGQIVQAGALDRIREIVQATVMRDRPRLLSLLRQANGPIYHGLREVVRIIERDATQGG